MSNLKNRLRDADPLSREAGLSPDDVARMRRVVVTAAHAAPIRPMAWGRQVAMAACLTVMVLTGLIAAHRVPAAVRDDPAPTAGAASGQPTQVHFSTPGGTRIIWTLDPGFQLRETLK